MRTLPVTAIIRETLVLTWQKRIVLFRALIATTLALAALDTLMRYSLKGLSSASAVWLVTLAYMILSWVLYTLFAVTCHRIVLLGDSSVPKYGLYSWTGRETKFFGWIVVVFLYGVLAFGAILLATVVVVFLAHSAVKGHTEDWIFLIAAIGIVPILYVSARLAVLFPATAIGERRDTDWAFAITATNGWRMAGALYFMAPVSLGVHALPINPGPLVDFLVRLLTGAFVAVGIVALSLSFRFLSSAASEAPGGPRTTGVGHTPSVRTIIRNSVLGIGALFAGLLVFMNVVPSNYWPNWPTAKCRSTAVSAIFSPSKTMVARYGRTDCYSKGEMEVAVWIANPDDSERQLVFSAPAHFGTRSGGQQLVDLGVSWKSEDTLEVRYPDAVAPNTTVPSVHHNRMIVSIMSIPERPTSMKQGNP